MFEPMGGSALKYTGKNVINPLATICAGGMMMDTLGEPKIAQAIDKAVHDALASTYTPSTNRPCQCGFNFKSELHRCTTVTAPLRPSVTPSARMRRR
jgi:isocitrate/isopropylmalate dehydrogenase